MFSFTGAMRRGVLIASATCVLAMTSWRDRSRPAPTTCLPARTGLDQRRGRQHAWTQVPASAPTGLEAFVSCPPQGGDQHDGIAGPRPHTRTARPGHRRLSCSGVSPPRRHLDHPGSPWCASSAKWATKTWRPYGRADGADLRHLRHRSWPRRLPELGQRHLRIDDASTIDYGVRCDDPSGQYVAGSSLHTRGCRSTPSTSPSTIPARPPSPAGPAGRCGPPTATTGRPRRQLGRQRQHRDLRGRLVCRRPPTDPGHRRLRLQPARPLPGHGAGHASTALNMGAFRDGQHQLQAVIKDAAGNPATAGPKRHHRPHRAAVPRGAVRGRRDPSRATNSFDVSWTNPDGQVAPISQRPLPALPGWVPRRTGQDEQTATESTSPRSRPAGPRPRRLELTVWLEDAAGNVGTANIAPLILGPGPDGRRARPASRWPRPSSIATIGWPSAARLATS